MSTPLFEIDQAPENHSSGEDLRMQVHAHLRRHPMLTAGEIARALRLPCASGNGRQRVRRQLLIMEDDGEAERMAGPPPSGGRQPAVVWVAT